MKTSSAKAKGRRLQQRVRDDLRALAGTRLDPTDVESTSMGVNGVDVILTKAARDLFGDLAIECKNVEVLNAVGVFQKHYDRYAPQGKVPLMVHSRNHIEPRVTLLWSDFCRLFLVPALDLADAKQWAATQERLTERLSESHDPHDWCAHIIEWRGSHPVLCKCKPGHAGDHVPALPLVSQFTSGGS